MQKLDEIIKTAVEALGLELYGYEFLNHAHHSVLRVYVDAPNGVTIDNCAHASRQISAAMDVADPIKGRYELEVSSPGIERPLFKLGHFEKVINSKVKCRLRLEKEGRLNFKGTLLGVEGETIRLMLDDPAEEIVLTYGDIERAKVILP